MLTIKTRKQAAEAGEDKYFTGRPCIHGHVGARYTSSGICCACNVAAATKYNKQMRQKMVARIQGHFSYPSHPDDVAALLAYAQALDIQRGRAPHVPQAPAVVAPFDPEEARRLAFGRTMTVAHVPAPPPPYLPKP